MAFEALISILDGAFYNAIGYFFVAAGIVISIRFTGFPDLTVDGSYTIGAVFYAALATAGTPIFFAFFAAIFAGMLGGVATGLLNQWCGLSRIIASVIVMIILTLISPYIADGATISLIGVESLFSWLRAQDISLTREIAPGSPLSFHWSYIAFWLGPIIAFSVLFVRFFRTKLGIAIRYMGSAKSPMLIPKKNRKKLVILGLALGNGLVALGGAIEVERNGGFTQSMGVGVLLIGLTIMVLGESLQKAWRKRKSLHVHEELAAIYIGTIVYALGVQVLLASGLLGAIDLKLLTALFLAFLLVVAARKHSSSESLF